MTEPRIFPMFVHQHGDTRCTHYVHGENGVCLVNGTISRGTAKHLIKRLQDFYDSTEVFDHTKQK